MSPEACSCTTLNDSVPSYHPLVSAATPSGDVTITSRQRAVAGLPVLGFVAGGTDPQNYYFVQWVGSGNGMKLYRLQGGGFTLIASAAGDPVAGQWYDMKLEITGTTMKVFIDGAERLSATLPAYTGGKVGLLGYQGSGSEYDDVTISGGGYLPSGTYTSSVFDAGASALWGLASWTADTPAGTTLGVSVRTGNTPTPDGTWNAFAPLTNGGNVGTNGRYAQYQAAALEQHRHRHTPPQRRHPLAELRPRLHTAGLPPRPPFSDEVPPSGDPGGPH